MKPTIRKKKKIWNVENKQYILHKNVEYCGRCDKTLNPYWDFCPKCGEPIERGTSNTDNRYQK